jgi:hypothetical protein
MMRLVLTSLLIAGCAVPAIRCPGEPLTASQIQDVRSLQQATREGRSYLIQDRATAEYATMCGKLDPVTKERVLP